jgi:hypothetical protein
MFDPDDDSRSSFRGDRERLWEWHQGKKRPIPLTHKTRQLRLACIHERLSRYCFPALWFFGLVRSGAKRESGAARALTPTPELPPQL